MEALPREGIFIADRCLWVSEQQHAVEQFTAGMVTHMACEIKQAEYSLGTMWLWSCDVLSQRQKMQCQLVPLWLWECPREDRSILISSRIGPFRPLLSHGYIQDPLRSLLCFLEHGCVFHTCNAEDFYSEVVASIG
jgi:hypothetical protein